MQVTRRGFVGTMSAAAGMNLAPRWTTRDAGAAAASSDPAKLVRLSGDGLGASPRDYATLLAQLASRNEVGEDSYLLGGEVAAFEAQWARLLGKEKAVFMPSGTLANHLALRALAGSRRRVIVPETSHVYNDTGDACQTLSGLTLMPLGANAATYTTAEVEAVLTRTAGGRVATEVGALLIESPIRRLSGRMFDWDEARRVTALARARGIGTHLDGARLFIASAYTGIPPAAYAAEFDTVYVSLWKYFNCGIGAILAGPATRLDGMHHTRRMFGGNLAVGWNAALVARHHMDGYLERLTAAVAISEAVLDGLGRDRRVRLERIPNGTNLSRLTFATAEPVRVAARLEERGVHLPAAANQRTVTIAVNETWTRTTAADLLAAFDYALG